jgi:hypothetical protein
MHATLSCWFAIAIAIGVPMASHALDWPNVGRSEDAQHGLSIASPRANEDTTAMPTIISMPAAGRDQLVHLFPQVSAVLTAKLPLLEKDPVFGSGKFFWPKDLRRPAKTMLSYEPERTHLRKVSLVYKRDTSHGPWASAELVVHPSGFPMSVYRMDLPPSFFAGFRLDKRYVRHAPHEGIGIVNVYEYSRRNGYEVLRLVVEARPDVSGIDSEFPGSFHKIVLSLGPKHDVLHN